METGIGIFAIEKIRQGRVIFDSPLVSLTHSCNPNAALRNGRIIAWSCIKPGEEITIDRMKSDGA